MCIMNILQRAYITLALLALSITLHPGQVEAGQITCSYHFNRVGAVEDRASCQYKDSVDYSCDPYSCATQENRGFESLYYRGCHGPQPIGDRQSIHAAQYFLRDDHADRLIMRLSRGTSLPPSYFLDVKPSKTGMAYGGTVLTISRIPPTSNISCGFLDGNVQ
ncbi:hypothetical protein PSHT_00193 [Puccinia striiformis]|uniref:Secreted protein n=2 Tax=Puccinia striiformis TaxID=27350 RepID=A0A2S4WNW4_9BASI